MKIITLIAKVVLSLIALMPVLGATGIFPPATPDMYNTKEAYDFVTVLGEAYYIIFIMAVVNILAVIAFWTKREALGALLLLPISVNVVAFHTVLDGGIFTAGASLGNVMLLLNLYFIWKYRAQYKAIIEKRS